MEKWSSLSLSRLLFDLASRLGSLEGYLYSEEKVEKSYLPGWLQNIEREFQSLPEDVKEEIAPDFLEVLNKVQALLKKLYGQKDGITLKTDGMIASLKTTAADLAAAVSLEVLDWRSHANQNDIDRVFFDGHLESWPCFFSTLSNCLCGSGFDYAFQWCGFGRRLRRLL